MNRQQIYKGMKKTLGLVPGFKTGLVVGLIVMLTVIIPVQNNTQVLQAEQIHVTEQVYSLNWSGYAVETDLDSPASNAVTYVTGSWTVPKVTGPSPRMGAYYSSVWVGIDGYSSNTVEQIGTEQDWFWGRPVYYAWFGLYPNASYRILAPVSPGDKMTAEVSYIGDGQFVFTLTNLTARIPWTFTTTQTLNGAQLQSAEWVVEAPSSRFRVLPLANFDSVTFSGASATLNSHTGTINDISWQNTPIDMVTYRGMLKATTSPLSPDGSSFSVSWDHI
jgi:hypothetical protein